MRWFVPSYCGDFRLEPDGEGSRLTVTDPTPGEVKRLQTFLTVAKERGVVDADATVGISGTSNVPVRLPVAEAGALLVAHTRPALGVLTAVVSTRGRVKLTHAVETPTAVPPAEADAAVTVRRPTPCCPQPADGAEVRASEVLEAFASATEWGDWQRDGVIFVYGGRSGHLYRIAHRESPLARRQGRMCADVTDGIVMHFHDMLVPPPEEALAAMLILRHREPWLRNYATVLNPRGRDVFANPIGHPTLDGIEDARFMQFLGGMYVGVENSAAVQAIVAPLLP